jgi:starch phosphorylase
MFCQGDIQGAMRARNEAQALSGVLYPSESSEPGRRLRLRQQFFFVSASMQDVVAQFARSQPAGPACDWTLFPRKVAIQLNDTHPTIAIPELLRLLLDERGLGWDEAWAITCRTFAFTNHTVLPEALERWSVPLLEELLPRHMQLIFEINHRFLELVAQAWPNDPERLARMSIIEESEPKAVRMAALAIVGSHTVNGVAQLHSRLVRTRLFPDFAALWPEMFQNKTNGITPRRWLLGANPTLAGLLTRWLGTEAWATDLRLLRRLEEHTGDPELQHEWRRAKRANKLKLVSHVGHAIGLQLDPDALFDMQCKRIHEYKRQLLNVLGIIHRYVAIRASSPAERAALVPRVCVLAGKAAPGYVMAKHVVALALAVADKVNSDPAVQGLLTVAFLPNYNVSAAEVIVPASDISQHISTAGMEASGTGNMKFALNGGLILGTRDGANIEIAEAVGEDNAFLFGARAEEIDSVRRAPNAVAVDERLLTVFNVIQSGTFGAYERFRPLVDSIRQAGRDFYLVSHDFAAYLNAQASADALYASPREWTRRSILCTARMARFSADRTVTEYVRDVWGIDKLQTPM